MLSPEAICHAYRVGGAIRIYAYLRDLRDGRTLTLPWGYVLGFYPATGEPVGMGNTYWDYPDIAAAVPWPDEIEAWCTDNDF